MLHWFLGCLFIIGQLVYQNQVFGQDLTYTCHAWGDPHLQTWRAHNTSLTSAQKQDCYSDGEFHLVYNPFVEYKVKTLKRLIVYASLKFFHPARQEPFCHLYTFEPLVIPSFGSDCAENGVTWSITLGAFPKYTVTINYLVNGVNFTTSIQRLGNYFNIHVWQPKAWASISSGLCTKLDPKCSRTQLPAADSRTEIITYTHEQAHDICQTHINEYLFRSPQKRNLLLNNVVDAVMDGCIEDVVYTGDIEMAKSGLDVLMMEELTNGVTSATGIKKAIDSGIEEASSRVEAAALEARVKVARFFQ